MFFNTVNMLLMPIKMGVVVGLMPMVIGLFLVHDLANATQQMIDRIKYETDTKVTYVKYDDVPYFIRPDHLYYNSYKDKILVNVNDKIMYADKYIDKKTNNIIYATKNGEMVIDSNIEQYKIGVSNVNRRNKLKQ